MSKVYNISIISKYNTFYFIIYVKNRPKRTNAATKQWQFKAKFTFDDAATRARITLCCNAIRARILGRAEWRRFVVIVFG